MTRLFCLLIGYFIGTISSAFIIGKLNGVDVRQHGSGNLGATNTMRTLGKKAGVTVMLLDFAKVILAVLLVRLLFGSAFPNDRFLLQTYTLLGCILGHDFPFYLKFKGGKGCACMGGYIIFFHPIQAIVHAAIFIMIYFLTHYVSLCTMFLYFTFFISVIILGSNQILEISSEHLIEVNIIYAVLLIITLLKHKSNIQRIIDHTENKTYLKKKTKSE